MGGKDTIVFLISAAASLICENRSNDELGFIASIYTLLGDSIAAIIAARTLCGADDSGNSENKTISETDPLHQ